MASYDLRQIVSALDDMNKAVYKIQHSTEVSYCDDLHYALMSMLRLNLRAMKTSDSSKKSSSLRPCWRVVASAFAATMR